MIKDYPQCHVYGAHGFNVWDRGKGTIDKLKPFFQRDNCLWHDFDYPWTFILGVYLFNKARARRLAESIMPGSIVIAHSNGCAIANMASRMTNNIEKLVYVNPALECDLICGPSVKAVDVWHSKTDRPVLFSEYLPCLIWGAMGRYGYCGTDTRYNNYEMGDVGHSGVFESYELMDRICVTALER